MIMNDVEFATEGWHHWIIKTFSRLKMSLFDNRFQWDSKSVQITKYAVNNMSR